ncbi:MAG: DUF4157 domain-containing protein [bacterium]
MADHAKVQVQNHRTDKVQNEKKHPAPIQDSSHNMAIGSMSFGGLLGTSATNPLLERHIALLGDPRLYNPANAIQRARILNQLHRSYGNIYVQRVVAGIRAKFKSGQPGDKYVQEADMVTDKVMQISDSPIQPNNDTSDWWKEVYEKRRKKARPDRNGGQLKHAPQHTPIFESQINSFKSGGQPLAKAIRDFFELRFGMDFSGVRVHTNGQAAAAERAVNARAFTFGRDADQNAPETIKGKKLLAHELGHVVQQNFNTSAQLKLKLSPVKGPEIARWSISGNKATVNKRSDRLWNLAKKITGNGLDWPCIWPIKMQSPKAYDDPYWRYLWIGDEFDISNLKQRTGTSATFTFELADDDLQTIELFYGGDNPVNLYHELEILSNSGQTPIENLTICGHTAGNSIWGDNARFSTNDLDPNEPAPSGAGAHNKMGPHRCWFTRNATVRIVGCTSRTVARHFADIFLRKGASALGTNHWVCWWHQTDPVDSRFASVEGPPCSWPPTATRLRNAAEVNGAEGLWVTIRGRL